MSALGVGFRKDDDGVTGPVSLRLAKTTARVDLEIVSSGVESHHPAAHWS